MERAEHEGRDLIGFLVVLILLLAAAILTPGCSGEPGPGGARLAGEAGR